ncbi:MAG: D-alanyl-D-alanine carboxypeptidase family protein [Methylococcales bacterium]|nr:D-alanyl-D-alanine carboxypeptidase [Methylococcaceae bacterium]
MTHLKFLLLLLNAVLLLAMPTTSSANHAAIIIDADSGAVLHEVNATHAWYPASLTKLMTVYMTFDAIKSGHISLSEPMTASSHAASQPNSKLGLRRGERISVQDAILAIVTRSANDASVVLAEHIGGSEENFAALMTEKAHALGMADSHFMNATGLPNDFQVTTPRDLAVLASKTLHNFPEHYHLFSAKSMNFRGSELRAINKFTASYPGAEGMKTGFTCGSGFNLIGAAQQNGKRLIGVVMGGMTSQERYKLMIQKMDAGFANSYADPSRTIQTMPTGSPGTPPYQLDCGNGAANSYAAANRQATPVSLPTRRHSYAAPKLAHVRHAHASKHIQVARHAPKTVSKAAITQALYKSAKSVKVSQRTAVPKAQHAVIAKSTIRQPLKIATAKPKPLLKVASKSFK